MTESTDFIVKRTDLRQCDVVSSRLPEPAEGQVLVRVDRFAFTANNVTYGAVGEMIGYWNFFPARDGWGRIPVWGFGDVVESRNAALPVGERIYGYFPMSTHVVLQPANVTAGELTDATPHRAALPPIYNQYTRGAACPGYPRELEPALALFRPLFTTSFLLEDALSERDDFGATLAVLTSASSKTALGLAFLLAKQRRGGRRVVGLTSPANAEFVRRSGYYDDVVTYDALKDIPAAGRAFCVDFAGNAGVLSAVHQQLGERLQHTYQVGLTHWENLAPAATLPGPTPVFFFAPDQASKRVAEWGAAEFFRRAGSALREFVASTAPWLRVVEGHGPAAVEKVYRNMVDGKVDPAEGHMITMHAAQN